MKRVFSFFLSLLPVYLAGQPVIQSANQLPVYGTTAPWRAGSWSAGPGNAGANVTWDFSTMALSTLGTVKYAEPGATPFHSSWPSATHAMEFDFGSDNLYHYLRSSADKYELLASDVVLVSTAGSDYSPDPLLTLVFPFNYGNSFTDTYQRLGENSNSFTVTYDGYGTLVLPDITYTNVVRLKMTHSSGDDYVWWSTSPVAAVLSLGASGDVNSFEVASGSAGVGDDGMEMNDILIYPNPARRNAYIETGKLAGKTGIKLVLTDMAGRTVKAMEIAAKEPGIELTGLTPGIYLYSVQWQGGMAKMGKLVVEP